MAIVIIDHTGAIEDIVVIDITDTGAIIVPAYAFGSTDLGSGTIGVGTIERATGKQFRS